ncbi:laccase [Pleurotus pulmonarius]|nr:laccase [Pleurotus pulmonarius]
MAPLVRALACLAIFAVTNVYGATVGNNADIYIANKVIAPDGFERSGVLAGTAAGVEVIGPLVRGWKGNRFRLNVINQLSDSSMLKTTSIHWHGFFQEGSSWADGIDISAARRLDTHISSIGPAFVTQCPIASGDSFLYDFRVPDQAGTFWYHAHLSTQYCDGLRGAFVVYDLLDPHRLRYLVDNEDTVITLADWGRYAGGPTVPLSLIRVLWGVKYRFRLVSLSCDPNYTFSIDGHKMTIIEVDGVNTKPLEVDSIQIFAGQRYSFVLHANQRIANYWIRANPNLGTRGFEGGLNSAILRYYGAPNSDPTTTQETSVNPLVETNLVPLRDAGAPGVPGVGNADVNINLAMAFDFPSLQFTINGAPWVSPTSPVLLQIISGASSASELLPPGSIYTLPRNKVVELSIPALAIGGPHPIHLHGHAFDVVRSAGSSTYNYNNPVRRDVVSTGTGSDNVTIRFKTDNPGPWFLHCHIDWHLEIGLAVVFAEDTTSTSKQRPPSE